MCEGILHLKFVKDAPLNTILMCGSTLQVYYDMYEKSKEKYAVEMQLYSSRAKPPGDDIPAWCTLSNNNMPDETWCMCVGNVRR